MNNLPADWAPGTYLDAIISVPDFDYVPDTRITVEAYQTPTPLIQFQIVSISGASVVLDAGTVSQLSVGNTLTGSGTTPYVQYVPPDAYQLLCQATAVRALLSLNDADGGKTAQAKYDKMEEDFLFIINPRVEGKPKKFNNVNSVLASSRPTNLRPLN